MNRTSSHPGNQTSTGRTFLAGFGAAVILGFALVAPPCLLGRTVGWPLPTQLPTPAEVVAVLTQVPTTRFLIVVLACVCWLAWAAFVLDVLAATIAAIRDLRDLLWDGTPTRAARPRRTIRPGAALVGLVVLALLVSSRTTPTTARPPTPTATVQLFTAAAHPDPDSSTGDGDGDGDGDGTVAVRPPAAGVHDSLWRIAQRELGNGNRWPELFTLNKNQPQPDGRTLIRPELIHPGWQIQLPTSTTDPHQGDSSPAGAQPAGPEVDSPALPEADGHAAPAPELAEPSTAPPMTTPPLQPPSSSPEVVDSEENWIELGPSVAIGSGLAATITAVVIAARRRSHRNARDARNGEPRLGPVIREISTHFTLTEATEPREPLDEDDQDDDRDLAWIDLDASPPQQHPSLELASEAESRPEHGSDSWTLLLDDAQRLGPLGVVGPGAPSALRALLIDAALRPPGDRPDTPDQIVLTVTDGAAATLGVPASALTRTAPGAARVNPAPQTSNAEPADDEGAEGLQVRILLADDGDEADVVNDESTAVLVLGPTVNGRMRCYEDLGPGSHRI
ncbi:hypothetical protein [Pseudonocardia sp. TRM90224]|uniref:hypothetical protein n=1 Tax=Pseudonocardia sp. TRM90224 TaxID=2812678 RepID=UPI001E4D5DC8|nr:hypothetical protein [Pseudonocardia sp. TRM90224]